VNPASYVRSIQRALGIEVADVATEKIALKEELRNSLKGATPEALARALEALKKEQ